IRPQVPREIIEMCSICTTVTPNEPQVWLGKDKAFTFDNVFDENSQQHEVYETCVKHLVEGCLEGYNATVLAYGQTGSGKTYTMGTGFDIEGKPNEKGIIPRAVESLFTGIRNRQNEALNNNQPCPEFKVNAQFLELYNEDIIDLLADERTKHSQIKVHEDASGGIYTLGATAKVVSNVDNTLQCLKKGALSRSTASTQMNTQSSRSHAIFTLYIKQQRVVTLDSALPERESNECNGDGDLPEHEFETLTAKFHFVDLAGSERLKRTGATGERQKEGISINSGLLSLGNVISALGDKTKRATHVPYRDSKLTRLLQDSLGGNSRTLMIACISPSDRDFMETLNTLRYANRAKNIKNKVVANQDKSSQIIVALRREIQQLQLELMDYKQGKRIIGEDGRECVNDMYHENTMLQSTINNLKTRVKALQDTNERLVTRNTELLLEKESGQWINSGENKSDISEIVQRYLREIEELRTKLIETEEMCAILRKQKAVNRLSMSPYSATAVAIAGHYEIGAEAESCSVEDVISEARKDISKLKKASKTLNKTIKENENQDTNGNDLSEDNQSINGDEVEESEESSNDESDDDEKANESEIELVELTNEISVKEKLIFELEKSQRKLNTLKQHYEDKLMQLQTKIHAIESERDQVLAKLTCGGNQANEKEAKKIRSEYEKKINSLQSEMKKLQIAKKEHAQAMRNQAQYENQLKQLKTDVAEMKKQKVKLLIKMKEESQRHREQDLRATKKIAQLSKQERVKDAKIRNLEIEKNRARAMLKRKDEEVNALKKRIKPMSDKVAGRVGHSSRSNGSSARRALPFSPRATKHKWQILEQNISKLILNKQTIALHEKQMERFLHQRDQVSHALEKAVKKFQSLKLNGCSEYELKEVSEEIDSYDTNIGYLNQNINECQSTIMQIEDGKDESELIDLNTFLNTAVADDIKYMFDKVLAMAVNQSLLAAQREEEKKEFELKYKQSIDTSLIQETLLHHVLETSLNQDAELVADDFNACSEISESVDKNNYDSTFNAQQDFGITREKSRRRTKTPQELFSIENKFDLRDDPMTKSLVNPIALASINELHRVPSAPSLK
ncbi:kinesin-like protein KIF21A, partial [Leptotrombidium deliense]